MKKNFNLAKIFAANAAFVSLSLLIGSVGVANAASIGAACSVVENDKKWWCQTNLLGAQTGKTVEFSAACHRPQGGVSQVGMGTMSIYVGASYDNARLFSSKRFRSQNKQTTRLPMITTSPSDQIGMLITCDNTRHQAMGKMSIRY